MRLNITADIVIHTMIMKPFTFKLGRYPRLALLLLLLAAQGFASVHELGDDHALKSDLCATCIIGHGLGAAVNASHELPQIQTYHALIPLFLANTATVSRNNSNFARAPPASP